MQYGNWVWRMGNPVAICPSTSFMVCFDALKPAWLKQLPTELVRTRGLGMEAAGGRVPLPSSATMAAHRDIGWRREEWQKYSKASGQTWRSCTWKSGNPKLPIALETGGKEMAHETKQAPGLTMCLSLPTQRPFFAQGALTGFSDLQAPCHKLLRIPSDFDRSWSNVRDLAKWHSCYNVHITLILLPPFNPNSLSTDFWILSVWRKTGDKTIRVSNTVLFINKACRKSFVLPSTVGLNDKKFSWLRSQTSLLTRALPPPKAPFFVYSRPASLQTFLLLPPCFPFLAAFNTDF